MKTHTIHWRSLSTGIIGAGTLLFEKVEAERLAEELNRDYPGIHHEAVEISQAEILAREIAHASTPISLPS